MSPCGSVQNVKGYMELEALVGIDSSCFFAEPNHTLVQTDAQLSIDFQSGERCRGWFIMCAGFLYGVGCLTSGLT